MKDENDWKKKRKKVLLGQDMCMEGGERRDSSVKSYLWKVTKGQKEKMDGIWD